MTVKKCGGGSGSGGGGGGGGRGGGGGGLGGATLINGHLLKKTKTTIFLFRIGKDF